MIVRLVGDLHGEMLEYRKLLVDSPIPVIQLGDLDLSGYKRWIMPEETCVSFIDGNHDHFPQLRPQAEVPYEVVPGLRYLPRGFVSGRVLFIGGADSTDRDYRTAGFDWFPEESISERDMLRVRAIPHGSIDVVISHCAPASIAPFFIPSFAGYGYSGSNSERHLEEVLYLHRPRLWVFGHYHQNREVERDGCRFVCLAEGQYVDLDLPVEDDDFAGGWELP